MALLIRLSRVAALLWCAGVVAGQSIAAGAERPNVLIIMVDDLNNWIGAMGGQALTPNIDRLAASGVLFTEAHCVTPLCNPSRVAILTGLRPETTGQFSNDGNFRVARPGNEALVTLPQYFRSNGYDAIAAGKVFHECHGNREAPHPLSDPVSWDAQRRGLVGAIGPVRFTDADGYALWHEGVGRNWKTSYFAKGCYWGPISVKKEDTGDWATAKFCADHLSQPHDKPFVLACGISRPHSPQLAPQEYFDRYPLEAIRMPECPADDMDDIPAHARTNGSSPMAAEMKKRGLWEQAVQAYLASTTFADECVGVVLDALDRGPHRDNTIVVLASDHGWHLGTKNRWEKFSLWHEATNAPLIIRAAGVQPGVCKRSVSLLDIYPTLVDLTGLPPEPKHQGISLRRWLLDPGAARATAALISLGGGNYGVAWEGWNYIRYADGAEEIYRHADDPHEFHNLAADPANSEMKTLLGAQLVPFFAMR